jgi:hypothetical protein
MIDAINTRYSCHEFKQNISSEQLESCTIVDEFISKYPLPHSLLSVPTIIKKPSFFIIVPIWFVVIYVRKYTQG